MYQIRGGYHLTQIPGHSPRWFHFGWPHVLHEKKDEYHHPFRKDHPDRSSTGGLFRICDHPIFVRDREKFSGERLAGASVIAVLALAYSMWAITGAGRDTIFWGLVLLLAGIPFYWLQTRRRGEDRLRIDTLP